MGSVHVKVDGHPLASLDRLYDKPHTPWFNETVHHGTVYAQNHGGLLPQTLVWHYFEAKHDLAPHRFDKWHPHLGKLIERAENIHDIVCTSILPVNPCSPVVTHCVPEPCSITLALTAIIMYFFKGRLNDHQATTTRLDRSVRK